MLNMCITSVLLQVYELYLLMCIKHVIHMWNIYLHRTCVYWGLQVLIMVAEWVKAPAVWCDPWPGHVLGWCVRIPLGAWLVCLPL